MSSTLALKTSEYSRVTWKNSTTLLSSFEEYNFSECVGLCEELIFTTTTDLLLELKFSFFSRPAFRYFILDALSSLCCFFFLFGQELLVCIVLHLDLHSLRINDDHFKFFLLVEIDNSNIDFIKK